MRNTPLIRVIGAIVLFLAVIISLSTSFQDALEQGPGNHPVYVDEPSPADTVPDFETRKKPAVSHGKRLDPANESVLQDCLDMLSSAISRLFEQPPRRLARYGFLADNPPPTSAEAEEFERLKTSPVLEYRYASVLLKRTNRAHALLEVLEPNTNDPLLAWHAFLTCAHLAGDASCPLDVLEDRVLALDGTNGYAWALAAAESYERGETASALTAMQRAAAAQEAQVHWADTVDLLLRAQQTTSSSPFSRQAILAFGAATTNSPFTGAIGGIARMCSARSTRNDEWIRACLGFGQLLERAADTETGRSWGAQFQAGAFEALGDNERYAAAMLRAEKIAGERDAWFATPLSTVVEGIAISTPQALNRLLDAFRQHGEIEGRHRFSEREVPLMIVEGAVADRTDAERCVATSLKQILASDPLRSQRL